MQTLLNNQESCIILGGRSTKYFKLEKGTRQGDLISAYLFILVLEIVCNLIKMNKGILSLSQDDLISAYLSILVLEIVCNLIRMNKVFHSLNFLEHTLFYTGAYSDDITFFLKDKESVKKLLNVIDPF